MNKKRIDLTNGHQRDHQADYGSFKSTQQIWRDVSTSWKPLSIKRSHLQACHIGGAAITECVRAPLGEGQYGSNGNVRGRERRELSMINIGG